jgi:transmembrane sensor
VETPGQREALIGVGRRVVKRRGFGKEPALSGSVMPPFLDPKLRPGPVGSAFAIGTAFNIGADAAAVEVLVNEGSVRVTETVSTLNAQFLPPNAQVQPQTLLTAGQQVVVPLAASAPVVATVSEAQIHTALERQTPRLQFFETPLADAVAEFNRHSAAPLVLADPGLGTVTIGGTFRVDNVAGFVRLLELTVDVRSEPRADGAVVLKRAR